jgi:uncharacterized protein (DUF983 family)
MSDHDHPAVSPYVAGLLGRCPRCGKGKMFRGLLALQPSCSVCGLDYAFADAGDGPAIFVMTVAGFVVLGLALYVDAVYQPPYWVHALIVLPLSLLICVALLRPAKGILIALQYFNKAEEHRAE